MYHLGSATHCLPLRLCAWPGPIGGAPGILSINIDPESLMDDRVVDTLLAAVEDPGWGGAVGIAGDLGVRLVAEGIETQAERDTVRQLGCSIGQGFLWARPGPLSSVRSPGDRLGPARADSRSDSASGLRD